MGIEIAQAALGISDRIEFFRTLSAWLTSGGGRMSVAEAVKFTCEVFSRDEYRSFSNRMERIAREVQGGQTPLYEALRQSKVGFTEQEIHIVEAAERSNQLRVAVPALVEALDTRNEGQKMLVKQLTMPVIGGIMLILMSIGVMTFMLPTVLGPVLQRNPDALLDFPIVIQIFWAISQWLQNNWWIPVAVVMVPVIMFLFRKTDLVKPIVEKALMSFGPTKRLMVTFNAVLVVFFMPALVRSGMTLHEVMRSLASTLNNATIAGALRVAANDHESGIRLGEALSCVPFRGSFRSAVEAGEKTGAVADRVEELQIPYKSELERVIRKLVATLTILVMAVLLPFFLVSMYTSLVAPIFALMEY